MSIIKKSIVRDIIFLIIGIVVTTFFYNQSSKDLRKEMDEVKRDNSHLRKEAEEIKKLSTLSLRAMEQTGDVKFTRDKDGNITGIEIRLRGSINAKSSVSGTLTVE
jgi:hypothetical protein